MSLISAAIGISTHCSPAVSTRSSPMSAFVSASSASIAAREIADRHLIDWGTAARTGYNPYDFPAPTLVSVNTAVKLFTTFPMPDAPSVVPNGDGGISLVPTGAPRDDFRSASRHGRDNRVGVCSLGNRHSWRRIISEGVGILFSLSRGGREPVTQSSRF